MANKLVLIDGNSILYRAFFALPLLNNDKGVYTNGVFGFTKILLRILEEENPTHMLVAFDAGKTTFRHKTYKDYKGGREKTPSELSEQFPMVKELLDGFGIKHYELDLYEADDIIGTLSLEAQKKDWTVTVISGDKDMLQLVSDQVSVHVTKKGISEVEKYTPVYMQEKMEIAPDQIIDLKALMGDSSDNIPGVPGVGEKTATKLLKQFGKVEEIYEHMDEVSGKKLKEKLENHKEDASMSKELVTINRHSPIEVNVDEIPYAGYEEAKVSSVFKDLGFQSLLENVSSEADTEEEKLPEINFTVLDSVTEDIFTGEEAFLVDMLGENYHTEEILGFGIVNELNSYFVPTEVALESAAFKQWAENEQNKKYVFDMKKTLVALLRHDIQMKGFSFDMLLSSYLLDPSENSHDIPAIANRQGKKQVQYDEEVYGKGAKLKVPERDVLTEHIVRKTNTLFDLQEKMEGQLKDNEQYQLYKELELPLAYILGEMEHTGVLVDIDRLKEIGANLKSRLDDLEKEIFELADETFNINSPKQLGVILFEKLELPVIKKTKTGYSTAADVLEKLEAEHPIISKILLYRTLGKLQSTYIEGLLKVVDPETHKVHTRFNQALTQTGRLSSTEPNLQNIPIRLEEGRKIRQAFIPQHKDWIMFSCDYSQIELRVLAHIAGDERLVDAFNNGMDIHTKTAMDVFHVDEEAVDANMRRQAKAVNFGIVYGISDYGLSQSLGISRAEAKKFIDQYFDIYTGVKEYMDDIVRQAKHQGYVTTIMNRRRYLPEITSRNFNRRSFAERTAMNTPIQGSAADIIKKAMIDLDNKLKASKLKANLLMQVHDELILEAPKEELETLKQIVPEMMENTIDLNVPLEVDYAYGDSWFDAK